MIASGFRPPAPAPLLTYLGGFPVPERAKIVTIPGVPLGPDFPGRRIVVAVAGQTDSAAGDLTAVTVGGVALTVDATSGINRGLSGIASGSAPGTSADITLTAGASTNAWYASSRIAVYALRAGLGVAAAAGGSADGSVSIDGAADGVTIVASSRTTVGALAAPIVTDYDDVGLRFAGHVVGHDGPITLQSGSSGSLVYQRIAAATYAP